MSFCKRLISVISIVLFFIIISIPAWSYYMPRVNAEETEYYASVTINDRPAIRFKTGNGILSRGERAKITSERLAELVESSFNPWSINVKGDKNEARIYAGDALICIVTKKDALQNSTTTLALAGTWASAIRTFMLMPAVTVGKSNITIPIYEDRRVDIGGGSNGVISAVAQDESIAVASVVPDGRYLLVKGLRQGSTSVKVVVDGESAEFNVFVKKYAGYVSGNPEVTVTGSPSSVSLLKRAIVQVVKRCTVLEPGSTVTVDSIEGVYSSLGNGLVRGARASVTISGEDYLTYKNSVRLTLRNIPMKWEDPTQLFYSNSPERLLKYQVLFAGMLKNNQPTRVLYHHQNMIGSRARFLIELINYSSSPASFRIHRGVSNPSIDTVLVGYVAGKEFLQDFKTNASIIETLPPSSRLVLISDDLKNRETTSGIFQIKQISGADAYVKISALPPGTDDAYEGAITAAPNMLMLDLSKEVYPSPAKNLTANYEVGKHFAFIDIGKHALRDNTTERMLYGNYGVSYQIDVKLSNPTSGSKKISILFDPTAGLASGVFLIDGKIVSAKNATPPEEFHLKSYVLEPGEIRNVNIITVPLAGSNYPAKIIVRS